MVDAVDDDIGDLRGGLEGVDDGEGESPGARAADLWRDRAELRRCRRETRTAIMVGAGTVGWTGDHRGRLGEVEEIGEVGSLNPTSRCPRFASPQLCWTNLAKELRTPPVGVEM